MSFVCLILNIISKLNTICLKFTSDNNRHLNSIPSQQMINAIQNFYGKLYLTHANLFTKKLPVTTMLKGSDSSMYYIKSTISLFVCCQYSWLPDLQLAKCRCIILLEEQNAIPSQSSNIHRSIQQTPEFQITKMITYHQYRNIEFIPYYKLP